MSLLAGYPSRRPAMMPRCFLPLSTILLKERKSAPVQCGAAMHAVRHIMRAAPAERHAQNGESTGSAQQAAPSLLAFSLICCRDGRCCCCLSAVCTPSPSNHTFIAIPAYVHARRATATMSLAVFRFHFLRAARCARRRASAAPKSACDVYRKEPLQTHNTSPQPHADC